MPPAPFCRPTALAVQLGRDENAGLRGQSSTGGAPPRWSTNSLESFAPRTSAWVQPQPKIEFHLRGRPFNVPSPVLVSNWAQPPWHRPRRRRCFGTPSQGRQVAWKEVAQRVALRKSRTLSLPLLSPPSAGGHLDRSGARLALCHPQMQ